MKIIILDYNTGEYINIFEDDLPDYGDSVKRREEPEVGLSILWIDREQKKEQNGEREISSFTINESIDYIINALNGKYQDPYKDYLTNVLEHIRGSPVDESLKSYLEQKEKQISKAWKLARRSGHDYYKGQFLLMREILNPSYRRDINFKAIERDEKRLEVEDNIPWFNQKQTCGVCKEEMVMSHGSNDEDERIEGFRCPRCDSEVQITIPHETGKTPRWKLSEK